MARDAPDRGAVGGPYACYVLGVLVLVYVVNFLDRQLPAILAEPIKRDLATSDAQLGYLYGTAFAVFYALFGLPLGRLADVWDRRRLIAIGLAFWSLMTIASGFARSFGQLSLARVGVGVGEASATPAAYSLLSDYFSPRQRATVLAVYSSGIFVGSGLGLFLGGLIVDRWDSAHANGIAPFGLRGWHVAFVSVGLPGLLLALWTATLREPPRGWSDGLLGAPEARPWRAFFAELGSVLPPFTLLRLRALGARRAILLANLASAAASAALAWLLTRLVGTPAQWWSLALGLYAALSWAQCVGLRDPPSAALLFKTPSLRHASLGFACISFSGYALTLWLPTFFVRLHGLPLEQVGFVYGGVAALGGFLGVTAGGLIADRWRRSMPCGRLYVGLVNAALPIPLALALVWSGDARLGFALSFPLNVAAALWLGPGASTVQDLVLPRMRSLASAAYLLLVTLVGLALGPYLVGRLSVATGDLRLAISLGLGGYVVGAIFLLRATRTLARDEATRLARARAAGEA